MWVLVRKKHFQYSSLTIEYENNMDTRNWKAKEGICKF